MRLIDYDKAIDRYYAEYEKQDICDGMEDTAWLKQCFEEAPTIDAVPIRCGRWKLNKDGSGTCDQCHCTQDAVWDMDNWQNFCGHCGADMREVE